MDCLTGRFQDLKCKDDKSEKIEQKFDFHNRKGSTKAKLLPKEETPTKIESKGTAVKIESPGEQQEKISISASVSQKDIGKSPDPESKNEENEKSAFMISGNNFELSFLNNISLRGNWAFYLNHVLPPRPFKSYRVDGTASYIVAQPAAPMISLLLSIWTLDTFLTLRGTQGFYRNHVLPPRPSKSYRVDGTAGYMMAQPAI